MKKTALDIFATTLTFILIILGLFYAIRAYAIENPHALHHINLYYCGSLAYDHCKTPKQKYDFHKANADRCYEEAKERCWWLPKIDERKKARYCLTSGGAMLAFGDPRSKLMAAFVNALIQYGLDCCDEWEFINNKFYWAEYHYEMMEFYGQMLNLN